MFVASVQPPIADERRASQLRAQPPFDALAKGKDLDCVPRRERAIRACTRSMKLVRDTKARLFPGAPLAQSDFLVW